MTKYLLLLLFSFPLGVYAQSATNADDMPRTVLWEVTGPGTSKPSYLLGTYHLLEGAWLYRFSEIREVLDRTEFMLSEGFSTSSAPSTPASPPLKALAILTPRQFSTIDSFFIAQVGEGIVNNPDAAAMTVGELNSAILFTAVQSTPGANGITKYMDLDLFTLFTATGKPADALEEPQAAPGRIHEFVDVEAARQSVDQTLARIKNSHLPGWNIYNTPPEEQQQDAERYQQLAIDYKLNQPDSVDAMHPSLKVRNKAWMPKIESTLSEKSCLIMVGCAHLWYQTGLISLLRKKGYTVRPLPLTPVTR
ncbi:hypothetical protein HNQ92_001903 [Rhabdobacter roseus]|uniref:TraB/GumN family protein n=1 Tax=Rhabdobacter roseus TaxID=1655419 RepID=A0A840TPY0_9BACT|nr:TraB/GumN family protein [Rhabdobacter roseus]MBB5283777.1 hypothetical protein [Rhabdobacter roseus]